MLAFEWDLDDELSQLYLRKDMDNFWKKWQKRFCKRNIAPPHIGGNTEPHDIAECFNQAFSNACFNSYSDEASIASLKVRLCNLDVNVTKNTFCVSDIENALKCLKNGKAAGYDGIVKEHLLYAHPSIIVHIMFLFNIMTLHCFVPDDFGVGVIVPIIKDRLGDITDVNNYRGITLSPVVSKLFEYCLLDKYQATMITSDVLFGF